jgi:hypothetical protein
MTGIGGNPQLALVAVPDHQDGRTPACIVKGRSDTTDDCVAIIRRTPHHCDDPRDMMAATRNEE